MSQEMSKFLGGIRRGTPQDRAKATRGRAGAAGGAATQATQPPRWNQRPPIGGASAAPKRTLNKVRPGATGATAEPGERAVPKRAAGGGGPTRVFQTTATSTLRRRQVPPPPPRVAVPRRIIEVKWIMKPSQSFVPGSESSSEDVADIPRGEGGDDQVRDLNLKSPGQAARTRVRASRMFRVPSQRIMHVEELKQAQLQQMHPRRPRTTQSGSRSRSRSPNWSASRSPSPLPPQSPTRYPRSCPSRSVSRQEEPEELKDVPLQDAKTVTLISRLPSPIASPYPSQNRLQIATSSNSSSCTMDTLVKGSTSSSNPHSSASSSSSSSGSSLSTSGTECSGERLHRGLACKAIKLTSTVIEIIKPPAVAVATSKAVRKSRGIPREKKQEQNAPMIQSIAPPKLQVPVPISQSVNHVVNQLTAQLKEAAMMHSKVKDPPPKDQDVYQAWPSKAAAPSRKPSIYLLMNQQPKNPSDAAKDAWVIQPMEQPKQQTNRYLNESRDHPRQHLSHYMNQAKVSPPKDPQGSRNPSRSPSLIPPQLRITKNPYIEEPKMLSKSQRVSGSSGARTQPVSLNRINRPPYVVPTPPPPPPEPQQQHHHPVAATVGGKIVRKAQHKVPRTMEDGIDMSYQYFVSIPLKRGKKPQAVRYLYRPMVRQLNATISPNRRTSRRAKRRAAAAAATAAAGVDSQEIDPELKALGGMPLPLVDPPQPLEVERKLDPEEALDAPYEVPPLKLDARFKPMMEQLAQMPYPEERPNRRRRRARAAGGAEQVVPPSDQHLGTIGGGDASLGRVSSIWKSGARLPRLINYRPEAKRLRSATGAPISYHTPVQIGEAERAFVLPMEPMIQAITYDDIEQRDELKKEMDQLDEQLPPLENRKAVSFHPGEVKVSEIPARSSSSVSISSTSSGAKMTKGRRPTRKGKAKSKGKAKVRR